MKNAISIQPKDSWQLGFLETSQRIDRQVPGMPLDVLENLSRLSVLRRAFLLSWAQAASLWRFDHAADEGAWRDWWEMAVSAGGWLLSPQLDGAAPLGGLPALLLASSPVQAIELGTLYQQLREVALKRQGAEPGHLLLTSGRGLRRRAGLFYTPEWMAARLAQMAMETVMVGGLADGWPEQARILDPACGSGRLLLACVDFQLSRTKPSERGDWARIMIGQGLHGVDRDPIAVALTRSALWSLAGRPPELQSDLEKHIVSGDTIAGPLHGAGGDTRALNWAQVFPAQMGPGGRGFGRIIGNPPFEVFKGLSSDPALKGYLAALRSSGYQMALCGNLNSYRLFLERALEVLMPGGRLAFVVPYGFLMDKTAAPLRSHLLRQGWLRRVDVYLESARTFEGVGQSVVLILVESATPCKKHLTIVEGADQTPTQISLEQLELLDDQALPVPLAGAAAYQIAARLREQNDRCFGDLAEGRVGEVDQTFFKRFMRDQPDKALLVRGTHLEPYRASLDTSRPQQRWLEADGFAAARGRGLWKQHLQAARIVQTGIVNIESPQRLVAAEVPKGIYAGNSLNYWVPRTQQGMDESDLRGYLLGLLNCAPLEWRFRLTSSNNNINLYEMRLLPLPSLASRLAADRVEAFVQQTLAKMAKPGFDPAALVMKLGSDSQGPQRKDRAVALLIARVARLREQEQQVARHGDLDRCLDFLICWHLGLALADLDRIFLDLPGRQGRE